MPKSKIENIGRIITDMIPFVIFSSIFAKTEGELLLNAKTEKERRRIRGAKNEDSERL